MTEATATYQDHVRAGMLRRLYQWCIDAADKPHATWLMGIVSFVESAHNPDPRVNMNRQSMNTLFMPNLLLK